MNKDSYLPRNQRKTILLLSDDIRFNSGIATMSRELVLHTCNHFNWLQIGSALKHPQEGQLLDLSPDFQKITGVEDAYVRQIAFTGYGNEQIIRDILKFEKIDAIMPFTDPRFFTWLFNIEHEIRMQLPIIYLNIWDNYPPPQYNYNFYKSCDLLFSISKQTKNINKMVLDKTPFYN